MNKILITITFILFTNIASSNILNLPSSNCNKYLNKVGYVAGVNKRKNPDGTSRIFIVGIGWSYLSHYERDEQGKKRKFKLPIADVVLNSQMEALKDALNKYKNLVGYSISDSIGDLIITDKININAKIKLLKTIPSQGENSSVCSIVAIIPNK